MLEASPKPLEPASSPAAAFPTSLQAARHAAELLEQTTVV